MCRSHCGAGSPRLTGGREGLGPTVSGSEQARTSTEGTRVSSSFRWLGWGPGQSCTAGSGRVWGLWVGRRPPACAESLCMAPMCRSGSLHHFKPSQAPGTKVTLPRAQGLSGSGTGDIALNTGRVLAVPFQPGRGGPGGQRVGQEPRPAQGLAPGGCVAHKMEHCLQPGERGQRTGHRTDRVRPPPSQGQNRAASGRGPRGPSVPHPPTPAAFTYSAQDVAPWGLGWAL